MKVTAIFETEDMAQIALTRLREADIPAQGVRIYTNNTAGTAGAPYMGAGVGMGMGITNNTAGGGFGVLPVFGVFTGRNDEEDHRSREVLLEVSVLPQDVRAAESVLINARGRHVTIED